MKSCPYSSQLEISFNDSSDEEIAELEGHLNECEICQQALLSRSESADWRRFVSESSDTVENCLATDTVRENEIDSGAQEISSDDWVVNVPGYDVFEEIGRGGMGRVFRARHRRLDRDVALKLLTTHVSTSPTAWLRMQTEAQAIARLQHPGIVQVFDSGEANGYIYICQELAADGNLDQRINHTPQNPEQAANWVRSLALATEHAHQQGVLHRDLKPSNVLFSNGVVKLADFGLAKFTDVEDGVTQTTDVVGTPRYMAPEQATGQHRDVGPATDVYAMGTILYEMLCGSTPFHGSTPVNTIYDVIHSEPLGLRQRVADIPKDLETICLKCLQKEPAKRYGSMQELADDLQRFVDDQPVKARPISRTERTWKWCRRHPATASLIAVSVVAATILIVIWALFTNELARQTTIANQGAEDAKRSLENERDAFSASNELLRFMTEDLFDSAVSDSGNDYELTVVEVFIKAGESIDGKFADRPATEGTIRATVGNSLLRLGKPLLALPHLAKAVDILETLDNPPRKTLVDAKHAWSTSLSKLQRDDEAKVQLDDLLQPKWQLTPEEAISIRYSLSTVLLNLRELDTLRSLLDQLYKDCLRVYTEDHAMTVKVQQQFGIVAHVSGDSETASRIFLEVLDSNRRILGHDHRDTLNSANSAAVGLVRIGKLKEAELIYRDTHERRERVLGPAHHSTLGSKKNLALNLWRQQRGAEAVDLLLEVLPEQQQVWGDTHFHSLATINEIGNMKLIMGPATDAVDFLDTWFQPLMKQRQNQSVWGQVTLVYCRACISIKDWDRARSLSGVATEIFENAEDDVNPNHLKTLDQVKETLRTRQRNTDAIDR